MKFLVYCDGSGGSLDGCGGIGFVSINTETGEIQEDLLPLKRATSQQAEILAAAYALHKLPERSTVEVWSDSEYVVKGMTQWMPRWLARGWRGRDGAVRNRKHWERLLLAVSKHDMVDWRWLRGHDGHEHNERADKLAGKARRLAMEARPSHRDHWPSPDTIRQQRRLQLLRARAIRGRLIEKRLLNPRVRKAVTQEVVLDTPSRMARTAAKFYGLALKEAA